MAVTVKKVEELDFYLKTRKLAVREITSESWDPLCVIGLRIAFKKGYEAKQFYDNKKK
ncbi:unnamed protein product [marine sediment metagenome]|uniref:Uncharacterized protein n=1 Tax=marine sediment metagenome TaxID=412755 RepID=X1F965_9ZZZZ